MLKIRCGTVVTDNIVYAKFRKNLPRIRSGFVIFVLQTEKRASEGSKIKVFKNTYINIRTENSILIVKK